MMRDNEVAPAEGADNKPKPMTTNGQLFRYATRGDKIMMIIGSLAAMGVGAGTPLMSLVFGDVIDIFLPENLTNPNFSVSDKITKVSLYFLYIAAAAAALAFLQNALWSLTAERQIRVVREKYLRAVLKQEIGWYDTTHPSELSTRIANDTQLMLDGMGEKVSQIFMNMATFAAGIAVGLAKGWQLTLVILAISPALGIVGGITSKILANMTVKQQQSYAKAGGVAEETISGIRTVATFSGEEKEGSRFERLLDEGVRFGVRNGGINGIGFGSIMLIIYGSYGLAFWYGSKLIADKTYNGSTSSTWTGGDVTTVFFSVLIGTMGIGQISPATSAMAQARASAWKIFEVIDRPSNIDPYEETGVQLDPATVRGEVVYRNIEFAYPSRPEVPIFRGFNLTCKAGETTALVGDSGGGKSTVIGLLERFYDPAEGEVLLDGIPIKNINLRSLRTVIGLVSQEPTLFAGSIAENIRMGKPDAEREEIIEAAKKANAHNFISALPNGYDTVIGEKGSQISGGQKQRVAIARAIIKNPAILLLDEATSALDAESEAIVQEALDRLMVGRTTIVIAHRLSTIRNAHCIAAVRKGQVVEQGTHSELLELGGLYSELHNRAAGHGKEKTDEQKQKEIEMGKKHEEEQIVLEALKQKDAEITITTDGDRASGSGGAVEMTSVSKRKSTHRKKNKMEDDDVEANIEPEEPIPNVTFWRILSYSAPEKWQVLFGLLGAAGMGVIGPIYAIIFASILKVFQDTTNINRMQKDARFWALMFVVLGGASFISIYLQLHCFTRIGEYLTARLRAEGYKGILRQEMGFFDRKENRVGTLTANLATDAAHVRSLTTSTIGVILSNIATVIAGAIIALIAGWKLALVVLSTVPLALGFGFYQIRLLARMSKGGKDAYGTAGQIATEAIGAIRTVASFAAEEQILSKFTAQLEPPFIVGKKRAYISGFANGLSQFINFSTNTLAFWYGGLLIQDTFWKAKESDYAVCPLYYPNNISGCQRMFDILQGFSKMMQVFMAVIMVTSSVSRSFAFLPDTTKAMEGAAGIFRLIDRRSKVDPTDKGGLKPRDVVGEIEFRNVNFAYPTRRNKQIFKNFNLTIPAGKTCALVGDSGGGKSTVIQMLERFYEPQTGQIFVDGIDVRTINIQHLRECMGLVSQEPTLFDSSILNNIRYGRDDATLEEVEEAAKAANAHEFIVNLPQGYDTPLGDKFTQLSGGQKQRVAIARAILRNPKVMLLDEATSALDSQSERLVQQALDNLMKGRTAVIIAHRLTTVKNADMIVMLKNGEVMEIGTHDELVERRSYYYHLVQRQL